MRHVPVAPGRAAPRSAADLQSDRERGVVGPRLREAKQKSKRSNTDRPRAAIAASYYGARRDDVRTPSDQQSDPMCVLLARLAVVVVVLQS